MMKNNTTLTAIFLLLIFSGCSEKSDFPLTDLHIHLKGKLTIKDAAKKSKDENIQYGIAVNCGLGFPVHSDSQIDSVLQTFKGYPQFYLAMQAEGREWVDIFSKESREKFDYVFTDAMTFTDEKGRRNRIWIKNETWIDDEDQFMDYLVNTLVKILNTEPINIYVNPTYLPEQMAGRYSHFWTEERMDRVIRAAKNNNIAIEINNRFRIPSADFIKRAKAAGVKFTIGTNNADENFSGAAYAMKMIKECNLTKDDFYLPVRKQR
jgi:Txe/YoeB family toxin of Txe-Axe toxin-antitoxin module